MQRSFAPVVEIYARQPDDSWLLTVLKGMEATLRLPNIGIALPFGEIYQDVTFPPTLKMFSLEDAPKD